MVVRLISWFLCLAICGTVDGTLDGVVFEGGGVRGAAFAGAIRALEDRGMYVDGAYAFANVIGTSVGCLFSLAITLDIPPKKLERLVSDMNFSLLFDPIVGELMNYPTLADYTSLFSTLRYAYQWFRFFVSCFRVWMDHTPLFGLSDDSRLMRWIDTELIPLSKYANQISTSTTLSDLQRITNHTLTCFSTRAYNVGIVRFDPTNTENSTIRETVYASATIPIIFQPQFDENGFPLIDGSVLMNFPIYALDQKVESANVLGLSLQSPLYDTEHLSFEQCEYSKPKTSFLGKMLINLSSLFYRKKDIRVEGRAPMSTSTAVYSSVDFVKHLARVMIYDREWLRYGSDPINCDRVVYLNSRLNVLELDASKEKIKESIESAYETTLRFLDNREAMTCNCLAYIDRQSRPGSR